MDSVYYPGYSAWAKSNPRQDAMLRAPRPFDMGYTGSRGVMTSRLAGLNARIQSTAMGRAAIGGAAESLGFYVPGMSDQPVGSFLGVTESLDEMGYGTKHFRNTTRGVSKLARQGRFGAAARSIGKQTMRGARTLGMKGAATFAGKTALKSIPLISTAVMAYSGYQEGGVMGALGGIGESMAWNAGFRMAGEALGGSAMIMGGAVAGLAGIGLATYALGEAGRGHRRELRQTEFSTAGAVDALGSVGAATNRQRSMMALNNTHLNGRMAMGNEGLLMHGDTSTGMRGFR